jgi:AcrR family transcriptional regulator
VPKVSDAHRASRRRQVLDAATVCFAREGFHRTTMHDIVREAELSPGAVYGYFAGKGEIIEAIAAERHERERERIRALRGRPAAEVLRALARDFLGALAQPDERRRRRVGVQIWAEALRDPRVLRLVRRGVDEPLRLLAEVIGELQRQGELPAALDPEAAARVLIALFHGFVLQQSWDPRVDVAAFLGVVEAVIDALAARAND